MRFRFVEEHRGAFPIDRLCQVVNVSTRGLRAFRSRPASRRQRMDMVVLAHIKEQSRLSLGSYGRPRMTEERGGPVFSTSFMPRSALALVRYYAASFAASFIFGLRLS